MKRVAETSRSTSAYPRRRAVTACQVCRARRTKCDQKKPRCSFCEKTGAECISDPTSLSSFDPASLAILERLDGLERKLDSIDRGASSTQQFATPGLANEGVSHPIPPTESLLPGSLETVLQWPAFQGRFTSSLPQITELSTPGTQPSIATIPILGDELNASATHEYLDTFFTHVHPKNPILDEALVRRLVRRISIDGPGWDSESCLALLVCANGAVTRPFSAASLSREELDVSTGRALFSAAQKRMGMVLDSAGVVEAQCLFFVGVYLMSFLRPYDAWRSFLQGLAVCQKFKFMNSRCNPADLGGTTAAEESIYWSCWKSERELRLELGLPDFGSPSALTAPQRFPSLPITDDDRMLTAWYFYLSEISLWRLEMDARKDMSDCLSKLQRGQTSPDCLLDVLSEVSEVHSQQLVAWQESLPTMVSIVDTTPCGDTGSDTIRFVLRGRKTYVNELITWPFIVYSMAQPDLSPVALAWLSKGLEAHVERLHINLPGFYHRHHGTWLMIRSSARSACILLGIARSAVAQHLPLDWKEAVEKTIHMMYFWCTEVAGLEDVANFCQANLDSS